MTTNVTTSSLSVDASTHDVLLNDIVALSRGCGLAVGSGQQPLFIASDRGSAGSLDRHDTMLHGERISCFVVGGERRLCFPQVISQVLRTVSLADVNRAFQELNIHCSVCTSDQLLTLKVTGVMPMNADSCGLITKTDAERLVHCLLYEQQRRTSPGAALVAASRRPTLSAAVRRAALPVAHDCFGGARGLWLPELMVSESSACIECHTCAQLFPPARFCTHSHAEGGECRRVCHWGYDPANWRHYLHLPYDRVGDEKAEQQLAAMKSRFTTTAMVPLPSAGVKRSAETTSYFGALLPTTASSDDGGATKRQKLDVNEQMHQLYEMLQKSIFFQQLQQQLQHTVPATADAAVGLLALSSSSGGKCTTTNIAAPDQQPKSLKLPVEPLKKHLLHQFEVEQQELRNQQRHHIQQSSLNKHNACSKTDVEQQRPDSESTTSASESEDEPSLDALLEKHVPDATARRVIRAKIADSQRMLEMTIDSLHNDQHQMQSRQYTLETHNHLLQTEIAVLRNNNNNTKSHPSSKTQHRTSAPPPPALVC